MRPWFRAHAPENGAGWHSGLPRAGLGHTGAGAPAQCCAAKQFLSRYGERIFEAAWHGAYVPLTVLQCQQTSRYDLQSSPGSPCAAARPQAVVSIGDNAFNDLMPVAELGGRTVWMNPYPNIRRPHCDVELRTLQELCAYLAGL